MKTPLLIQAIAVAAFGLLLASCSSTKPNDRVVRTPPPLNWDQVWNEPASVEVLNMKPVSLLTTEGRNAWLRVPGLFTNRTAMIFMPTGPVNGVADYKVTKNGYLLVACDYTYQGNRSGGWQNERWTRQQFSAHGWREVTACDLGGLLVSDKNREQVVFIKKVAEGESGRLRCNKYSPPHFLVCGTNPKPGPAASSTDDANTQGLPQIIVINQTGAKAIPYTTNLTFSKAVLLAGGYSRLSKPQIDLVRCGHSTKINARDIILGKAKDIPLEPWDIIHLYQKFFSF